MARLLRDPSWWPNTKKHSAWVLVRGREFGPELLVKDRVSREWLLRALDEWRATRGGPIEPRRFARRLTSPGFLDALREAHSIQLAEFDPAAHSDVVVDLFERLDGIKASHAQLVAISKTLYHLLPELIVPFDGQVTCGFFNWNGLPKNVHPEWLSEVYSVLGGIAASVGSRELDRLGRPAWPLDSAVSDALRIGQARVVDFGLEGYRRSRAEDWYVD
jgi:hypothetical protein